MLYTDLAIENWKKKYRYGDELPLDTWKRLAKNLASVEKPEDRKKWENIFLKTLVRFNNEAEPVGLKFTTGGRITANAGTSYKKATLINCFVNGPVSGAKLSYIRSSEDGEISYPVKIKTDDSPDDLVNIFLTVAEQAKTLASEGGYGINFDWIRPRGTLIKGTGIEHPGVVSYMKIWDSVADCIVKGNLDGYVDKIKNYLKDDNLFEESVKAIKKLETRKGAMMGCLSVSHPDVEEFITAKQQKGVLTKFNMSVVIDDKFMRSVENNDFYDLTFGGKVYKRVKARDLYNLIMDSTYNRNEPGVIFVDNAMRRNPISYLGRINACNPCCRKGTLVVTSKGLKKAEDIDTKNDLLQTTLGFEKIVDSEIHNSEKIYRVHFSDGFFLDVSEGHIFHTQKRDPEIRKKWSNDVAIKDIEGNSFVRKEVYKYLLPKNGPLTRDMGLLVGLFLGEGHIDAHNNVCISLDKRDDERYITDLCDRFGFTYWFDDSSKENSRKVVIGGSGDLRANKVLKTIGIDISKKASEKDIPIELMNTNEEFLKGLIDGIISSDGNVNLKARYPQIRIKSCSFKLHEKIRHLILYFGADYKCYPCGKKGESHKIGKRIISRKHDIYEGHIDNDSILNLYRRIGFISQYDRNENLKRIIKEWSLNGVKWKTAIKSIEFIGYDTVYDYKTEISDDWNTEGYISRGCGEVVGIPGLTTVCLLGSFNLTQYVFINQQGKPEFDFDQYENDIRISVRMLDNINDLTYSPLPSYTWAIKNLRQIGIGINGLGSTLVMLWMKYGSKESLKFVNKINDIKENISWQASSLLAKEKGTFEAYNKEKFENTDYFKSNQLWPETKDLLRKYGARNAKTTTNPPLGNSSIICSEISNSIECLFMKEYDRKKIVAEWPEGLTADNVKKILKHKEEKDYEYWEGEYQGKRYYYEPHNRGLCTINTVRDYGYDWLLKNFPDKDHSGYLVTSKELPVKDHIAVQEAVQKHVNQSVSKTINLPNDYPFEDFKDVYLDAWRRGLNGLTTYRTGTMESVLSDLGKSKENKEIMEKDIKLPDTFMNGPTRIIKREGVKFYIHFSYLPEDTDMKFPVVIWIYTNNKEKDLSNICNRASRKLSKLALGKGIAQDIVDETLKKAKVDYPHNRLGRMISLNLRHNVPIVDILTSLMGIEGDNVSTFLTAVRKFLSESVADGTSLKGKGVKCPDCGSDSMVLESGCTRCIDCGFSGCG